MARRYKTGSEILNSEEWKNADEEGRRKIFVREVATTPEFRDASAEQQIQVFNRFGIGEPDEPAQPAQAAPEVVAPINLEEAAAAPDAKLEQELFGAIPPPPAQTIEEPQMPSTLGRAIADYPYALAGGLGGFSAGTAEAMSGGKDMLKNMISGNPPATSGEKWLRNWAGMERNVAGGVPAGAATYQRSKMQGKVGENIQRKFGPDVAKKGLLSIEGWMKEQQMLRELAEKAAQSQTIEKATKMLGKVPFGSTLAGVGAGLDVAETARRVEQKDPLGAAISSIKAISQAGMLLPNPYTRLGGLGLTFGMMPIEDIYQTARFNRQRSALGLPTATRAPAEIQYDPMGMPIR
jgi:hypothetical protein